MSADPKPRAGEGLVALARAAGIEPEWTDVEGRTHVVPPDTLRALLEALGLPCGTPAAIRDSLDRLAALRPPRVPFVRCPVPRELGLGRVWGLSCAVWSLRREPDPGMGDLLDLAALAERAGRAGADFVAVLPLHARFPADPGHRSPYAPSSRRFLDLFAVAPEPLVDEEDGDPALAAALERLRREVPTGAYVDHACAGRAKLGFLEAAFGVFRRRHLAAGAGDRGAAFLAWRRAQGRPLEDHCRFDALHEHMLATGGSWSFHDWPLELRRADSPAVEAFAREHAERVDFFAFCQWVAERQLAAVQERARRAGMRIGLQRDLAVGLHPAGSAAWSQPDVLVRGVSLGAPPDAFNPKGQDWGLAPFSPRALLERDLEPLLADLRANLRHAGALRIDHVMGLQRQFWIPRGASPAEGAYVRFPFPALASRLAAEARAASCLVVGEDLGTVPPGFRPRMRRRGMLGIRVLWFEREADGRFRPPARWSALALGVVSTHDLPTLRGFLEGRDIDWRERLGILAPDEARAERERRARDVALLLRTLRRARLLAAGTPDPAAVAPALHAFLARARSALVAAQAEDLVLMREQPNLPGTVDEHPNWCHRLPCDVDGLFAHPVARAVTAVLAGARPRP